VNAKEKNQDNFGGVVRDGSRVTEAVLPIPGRLSRYCTVCKELFHPLHTREQFCRACKKEYEFYSLSETDSAFPRLKVS
jgi:hypothetical protein